MTIINSIYTELSIGYIMLCRLAYALCGKIQIISTQILTPIDESTVTSIVITPEMWPSSVWDWKASCIYHYRMHHDHSTTVVIK